MLKLGRILKNKATLKVEDNKDTKNCVDDDNYLLRDTLSWLIFCLKERQEFCQSTYLLIEKSIVVVKIKYYILIYADSAEEQHTWQSKDVIVQDPLYTEEPLHSIGFVPHSISDAKVEQMVQMTTDSPYPEDMGQPPLVAPLKHDAWTTSCNYVDKNGKGIGDNNCIPTIEDCLSLFF